MSKWSTVETVWGEKSQHVIIEADVWKSWIDGNDDRKKWKEVLGVPWIIKRECSRHWWVFPVSWCYYKAHPLRDKDGRRSKSSRLHGLMWWNRSGGHTSIAGIEITEWWHVVTKELWAPEFALEEHTHWVGQSENWEEKWAGKSGEVSKACVCSVGTYTSRTPKMWSMTWSSALEVGAFWESCTGQFQ